MWFIVLFELQILRLYSIESEFCNKWFCVLVCTKSFFEFFILREESYCSDHDKKIQSIFIYIIGFASLPGCPPQLPAHKFELYGVDTCPENTKRNTSSRLLRCTAFHLIAFYVCWAYSFARVSFTFISQWARWTIIDRQP